MAKGPQPKHPDKRQRRNKPPTLQVVGDVIIPPPPTDLKAPDVIGPQWDEFWTGTMAPRVDVGDLPALYRLFRMRDEYEFNSRMITERTVLVTGSQGQLVENPISRRNDRLAKEIRALEDRFGLNPTARAQFAVSMGDLQRTMQDLARGVKRDDDGPDPLQIVDVPNTDT